MSNASRSYDVIVLGATGFTGKLTAKHIASHLPTDLRWAVSGRSGPKLSSLVDELKKLNPDRTQPEIEVANLTPEDLNSLVKKAKVLINTVGPYHLYSSPVVEACANNGTHYLDVTGEWPWTKEMIQRYHALAKSTGAIMISQIGVESAPSDLITYALASLIRKTCNSPTGEVIATVHEMKANPSGGSLATVLTVSDSFSGAEIANASSGDWSSSPVPHPNRTPSTPFSSIRRMLYNVRMSPELGVLTTGFAGGVNRAIVQRTWGLLDEGKYYGPNFIYHEYSTVRNRLVGALVHLAITLGMVALAFPPFRWVMRKLVLAPGQGPNEEAAKHELFDFRAVAVADQDASKPRKALGCLRHEGGIYELTGMFLAEAAMVLLEHESLVKNLGGGYLTPAMLGRPFIDRLTDAGLYIHTEMLP